MNISARDDLYRELARVVRPGRLLAIYDVVVLKNTSPLTFPIPSARKAQHSHLVAADMLRELVTWGGWVLFKPCSKNPPKGSSVSGLGDLPATVWLLTCYPK